MFLLYGLLAGLVAGRLAGGHFDGLGRIRLRWVPLVLAAMAIQAALFWGPVSDHVGQLGPWIYVASTGLAFTAVVRNSRVPGLALVAAGAACNLSAIVANGGYMPASPAALAASGHVMTATYSNSSLALNPALEMLIDRFAMPTWVPFANVFSVGDALIAAGVMITVALAMRTRELAAPATLEAAPAE